MKSYKLVILISSLLQFIDRGSPRLSFILVLSQIDLNPDWIGFLYLRYVADPKTLWSSYEPYLKDDEDGRFYNSSVVHQHDSCAVNSLLDTKIQEKNCLGTCQQITLSVSSSEEIRGCRWRNFINDGDFKCYKRLLDVFILWLLEFYRISGQFSVIFQPQQQPGGLVAGSMDLVTILVKNSPINVLKAAYQVFFDPVVRIVLQTNDHSEMQAHDGHWVLNML
ncbi:hypothetical protein OROHE_007193 [Orobanche hederae]